MKTLSFDSIEKLIAQKRDEILIKATLDGNKKAFARLISYYRVRIKSLGMRFFKNEADTDDYVQEVCIKIFTNLKNFRYDSSFSTWITSIAYNTAINSKTRTPEYAPLQNEEFIYSKTDTPEEEQIKRITVETIRESVKELPEKYAICLDLYFFHDKSHEEISNITGFQINTIKSHIFRAKKILKEKLRGLYEK